MEENTNQLKDNNYKFCFRYTLSNNGKIAEKTKNRGWNCSIIGNNEIPKNKVSKFKIKLKKFETTDNSINTCIGIGPNNPNNQTCFYNECWSFACGESKLMIKSGSRSEYNNNYTGKLKEGDIIEVIVDRINGTLSFKVNDINYGIACSSIPNDIQLYPVINIHDLNQIVEIIDY